MKDTDLRNISTSGGDVAGHNIVDNSRVKMDFNAPVTIGSGNITEERARLICREEYQMILQNWSFEAGALVENRVKTLEDKVMPKMLEHDKTLNIFADPADRDKLEAFRKIASKDLRQTWSSIDELAYKVKVSLDKTIEMFSRTGWVRADSLEQKQEDKLDFDVNEKISIASSVNPFTETQPLPTIFSLKDVILATGSALKEYCQVTQIKAALLVLADLSYEDIDEILERLLYNKVIERGEIKNDYEGCYIVWSFTEAGLQLYLDLKHGAVG